MTQELISASAVADLPAVVAAYLLGLCDADCIASRDGATPAAADDSAMAIRKLKNCSDVLSAHLGRADFGCAVGELFIENAWLASFKCELTLDWSLGDEGQVYEETSVVILDLQPADGAQPSDEVRGTDGSLDREAAEAVVDAFFEEHRYELAQLLRDGTVEGTWTLHFDRSAIAAEIAGAAPSGRRMWDALLSEWPGLSMASTSANVVTPAAPSRQVFAATVAELLGQDGYQVHQGAADDATELVRRWWFTWSVPGMADAEVGDTVSTEQEAWIDALKHRLANSTIPIGRMV